MIEDLLYGWRALDDACADYEEAEKYYNGTIDEVFASAKIRNAIAATGDRYRFNLAKTPVEVMADRMELSAVTVPNDNRSTALIESVWAANDMAVYYPDLFLKMFMYGDAYLQVWPVLEPDDAASEVADADTATADPGLVIAGVELTVQSPKHCRVIYDESNHRRKAFAIKRWPLNRSVPGERPLWRVDLYYPDVVEQWVSLPGTSPEHAASWEPFTEESDDPWEWVIENPYGEIPFFHYRTALPYGRPEHISGYSCQDATNKMLINQLTTADTLAWPQRYSITDKGAELDQAGERDSDLWADGLGERDPATLADETERVKRAGPGAMIDFVGKKAVGQFAASPPGQFIEPAEFYIRLMAQLTTTPLHYFDPSGDAPSGESLRVAEAPLVKKVSKRQIICNGPVRETWDFVLRLLGASPRAVDVRWAPVASASGPSDWEVIAAKQAAGVPVEQTLVEAGYGSDVVARWMAEFAAAAERLAAAQVPSPSLNSSDVGTQP